ncbi:MAG: hypothetical protein JJT85_03305 [Chromatiales bacterium]|nr:hypothetical protein [Chromatiales bacterium]
MPGTPEHGCPALRSRGSGLPLLLMLLGMMALLAMQALSAVRTDLSMAAGLAEGQRAFALAEEALAIRASISPWPTAAECGDRMTWQPGGSPGSSGGTWHWQLCLIGEVSLAGGDTARHYRSSVRARWGMAVAEHHQGWIVDSTGESSLSFWHTGPDW